MKHILLVSLILFSACSSRKDPLALPESIEEAVSSNFRTPQNKARDVYRHPVETLQFFGLTPDMTVVEVAPGQGWYMEILAPLLAEKGRYIMAAPVADKPYFKTNEELINAWKTKFPMVGTKMETAVFSPPSKIVFPKKETAWIQTLQTRKRMKMRKTQCMLRMLFSPSIP